MSQLLWELHVEIYQNKIQDAPVSCLWSISGKVVAYDEPTKLMKTEGSLFGHLGMEYWSHLQTAESHWSWNLFHAAESLRSWQQRQWFQDKVWVGLDVSQNTVGLGREIKEGWETEVPSISFVTVFKYQVLLGNSTKVAIFARASGIYQSSKPIKED